MKAFLKYWAFESTHLCCPFYLHIAFFLFHMSQLVGFFAFGTKIILVEKKGLKVEYIWTISKRWSFEVPSIREQHIVCERIEGRVTTSKFEFLRLEDWLK